MNFRLSVIIAGLWQPEVQDVKKFLRTFLFFMVKFSKFCSESFHHGTNWRVVFKFREIWPTENQWNPAPKTCQSHPPTMYSEWSIFHPIWFTFDGVIAECLNTAKMHCKCKVNPVFGWRLASSRIIISIMNSYSMAVECMGCNIIGGKL